MKFPFFSFKKNASDDLVSYLKEIACNSLLLERRECAVMKAVSTSTYARRIWLPAGLTAFGSACNADNSSVRPFRQLEVLNLARI